MYKESPGSRNVSDQAAEWSVEGLRNETFWSSRSANSIPHRETNWGEFNFFNLSLTEMWLRAQRACQITNLLPALPENIWDYQEGGTELSTRTAASEVLPSSPAGVQSWGQRRAQALWIFYCDGSPWPSHSLSPWINSSWNWGEPRYFRAKMWCRKKRKVAEGRQETFGEWGLKRIGQ